MTHRRRSRVTSLAIGACAVVMLTACAASGSTAAKDVSVTSCTPNPTGGHPTAAGNIVNHSSKASVYTIHVQFTDAAGNGVGNGFAAVAKVDAGTTASWHADGTVDADGPLKCTLTNVTRNASP